MSLTIIKISTNTDTNTILVNVRSKTDQVYSLPHVAETEY